MLCLIRFLYHYNWYYCLILYWLTGGKDYTDKILQEFGKGQYEFYPGQRLALANSTTSSKLHHYRVTDLAYFGNCLGFSTETLVTIILNCPEKNEERVGCFQVLTPQFDTQNNTIFFTEKVRWCRSSIFYKGRLVQTMYIF